MDTFLIVGHFLLYMFDIALFAPIIYKIEGSFTQKLFRIKKLTNPTAYLNQTSSLI